MLIKRRFIIIILLFGFLIFQAQAWPWDSPEGKARIYLSELEEIARKAEDLDQIGWNPRANLLMKKLQGLGSPAVQPTITEMFNKDNDWKFRFVCIDLLHGIEELSEEEWG